MRNGENEVVKTRTNRRASSDTVVSRRTLLQSATALAALSLLSTARPAVAVESRVREALFPSAGADPHGSFEGTRYDAERRAIVLTGNEGAYASEGTFTSSPFALAPGTPAQVTWRPRWTTPMQWDRFAGNPILQPTAGTWDDTTVTTCSIVPVGKQLKMFYGARDRGIGLALSDRSDMDFWRKRNRPVLEAGAPGTFDAGGVLSPAVVAVSDALWFMYFVGYDPTRIRGSVKVHQIGLAKSLDQGETWARVSSQPVLALGPPGSCDGATISSNCVLKVGGTWYSWYTGISQVPYLASVCLATSSDGIHWEKYPHNPVLSYNPHVRTDAFMVATPQVLHEDGVFKMWYNAKGYGEGNQPGEYSICYAESLDGILWERCPRQPVLGPSGSGWDGQMVEYPEVLNLDGTYHLWYSGNGYGKLGHAQGRALASAVVETRTGAAPRPDATWSEWIAHATPLASPLPGPQRYLQVRVRLKSADRAITPMVQHLAVLAASKK